MGSSSTFISALLLFMYVTPMRSSGLRILQDDDDYRGKTFIIDSSNEWIPLGSYGLGDGGILRINFEIMNQTDFASPGRFLLAISNDQAEKFWFNLFPNDAEKSNDDEKTLYLNDLSDLEMGSRSTQRSSDHSTTSLGESSQLNLNRPALLKIPIDIPNGVHSYKLKVDSAQMITLAIANPFRHKKKPSNSLSPKSTEDRKTPFWQDPLSWFLGKNAFQDLPQMYRLRMSMNLEVVRSDGGYLEPQYSPLPEAFNWMSLLLSSIILIYQFSYWLDFVKARREGIRSSIGSLLGKGFTGVLLVLTVYWSVLSESLSNIDSTGDFRSFKNKVIPEFTEKVFDASELFIYMVTALGLRSVRMRLSQQEWRFVAGISTVMLYLGFLEIGCSPNTCSGYRLGKLVATSLGYLVIIVAVNFHVATLTQEVEESSVIQSPAVLGRMYQKLHAFSRFRTMFLFFLLQPSLVLYFRVAVLDWQGDWIFVIAFWVTRAALLVSLAYFFRPQIFNLKVFDVIQAQQILVSAERARGQEPGLSTGQREE